MFKRKYMKSDLVEVGGLVHPYFPILMIALVESVVSQTKL